MSAAVGKPMDRVDGRQKVMGTAPFAAEFPLKDMAYAFLVLSSIPKGKIKTIDTKAAEAVPGVLTVLTHRKCPPMKTTPVFKSGDKPPRASGTAAPILQTDRIYWNGQPIAVVVADTYEQARHAAGLVEVAYETASPAHFTIESLRDKTYIPKDVNGEPPEVKIGQAEAALAKAAVKSDHVYTTPRENHNPIEPHATTAVWDANTLTVYDATQYVGGVQQMLAEKFDLKQDNVRVISPFVGGAFGSKGSAWPQVCLAAVAAKAVNRPVKLPLTREQMYFLVGYRTVTEQRVALGSDAQGKLDAIIHTGISTTSTTNSHVEPFTMPARHLYASPNIFLQQKLVEVDMNPPTFMRAPGETPGTFALESAMDELAYELKIDPIELRLRNDPEKDPTKGTPFSHRKFKEALKLGAEKFGWAKRNPAVRSMRDGRHLVGYGMAAAFYPAYQGESSARIEVAADGSATVQCACHEMGMGTATVQTQHAADTLGLPVEKIRFEYGDTKFPPSTVAGGSRQTVSVGAAILAACEELKSKLLAAVGRGSPLKGAREKDVVFKDGGLWRADDPKAGETFVQILQSAGKRTLDAKAESKESAELKKFSIQSYGAQFCEVRVDLDLGEVRIARFVGAFDCGRILNAKTARSQLIGGIVMGVGMALMEETRTDLRTGRATNCNIAEYLVPTHADIPAIEAYSLDDPDPLTPMGAHGIGEIGITGVAAAVANAVFHATGKRIRELPITPDKLL